MGELVTAVGFEPTPFRDGALSHRLRPLGQNCLGMVELPRCGNTTTTILAIFDQTACMHRSNKTNGAAKRRTGSISGLVFYLVAVDVTRDRFPADAFARMGHQES